MAVAVGGLRQNESESQAENNAKGSRDEWLRQVINWLVTIRSEQAIDGERSLEKADRRKRRTGGIMGGEWKGVGTMVYRGEGSRGGGNEHRR